jgi:site-specific recombinase XerC
VTQLHKMMLEELQRRNYSKNTARSYLSIVRDFAKHFNKPPDQLGLDEIRQYQAHLIEECKLEARTVCYQTSAVRFFFVKTLQRPYQLDEFPYPKRPRRLPLILSQDEAVTLINSASNLFHRAMLMTLYSTGVRRTEMCNLKVEDIDSKRMLIHIRQGKGGKDRDVPLSPNLLGTLRVLPLDAAEDLSVSRHGEWLSCRQAHYQQGALGSLPGSGQTGGYHQTGQPAPNSPQLRYTLDGERRRPAYGASPARPHPSQADVDLPALVGAPSESCGNTARQGGPFTAGSGEAFAPASQTGGAKMSRPPALFAAPS